MNKVCGTTILKAIFFILIFLGYDEAMADWRIRIFDDLGPGQVGETATIAIGDVTRTINVDKTTPSAYAEFNFPNGEWPYSLQTETFYYNKQSKLRSFMGQGNGTLNCYADSDFDLELGGDSSVDVASVTLGRRAVERQQENRTYTPQQESPTYTPPRKPNCRLEQKCLANRFSMVPNCSFVQVCD